MKSRVSGGPDGAMEPSRRRTVLAVLAAGGPGAAFDAVRLQKLFFLVDREIPHLIGGPRFHHKPHHFGPFDEAVYAEVHGLIASGDVSVDTTFRCPLAVLTDSGVASGARILEQMPEGASKYMKRAARWILTTPFQPMLAGIYGQYPDMAVNSLLPLAPEPHVRSTFNQLTSSFVSGMGRVLDLFGTLNGPRAALDGEVVDALATYDDWCAVGADIEEAMSTLGAAGQAS